MKDEENLNNISRLSFRTAFIGGGVSILLVLIAILSIFTEGGDSVGPAFFIFGFLGFFAFAISSVFSLGASLSVIIKGIIALRKIYVFKDEINITIAKNVYLIIMLFLLWYMIFKFLIKSIL